MRIDYSTPRQSYVSAGPSKQRSSGGSAGAMIIVGAVVGTIVFCSGFGIGWYFSQQSAKKAFRAAMEQKSLENSPKEQKKPEASPPQQAPVPTTQQTTAAGQPAPGASTPQPPQPQAPVGAKPQGGQPLSFYENLPRGQKSTVLGSGINEKPKPAPPAGSTASGATPPAPAKTTDTVSAPPKTSAHHTGGYLVQAASFSSRKEADAAKAKLTAKGYQVSIEETTLQDKVWHRVRIGRHLDKDAALQIASQLGGGAKAMPDQE